MKGVRRRNWLKTEGTVTAVQTHPRKGGHTMVLFAYEVAGQPYTGTFEPTLDNLREGDKLHVRYDPDAPIRNNFTVKDHTHKLLWIGVAALVVIAAVLAYIAR
jgi:hypothetical protein